MKVYLVICITLIFYSCTDKKNKRINKQPKIESAKNADIQWEPKSDFLNEIALKTPRVELNQLLTYTNLTLDSIVYVQADVLNKYFKDIEKDLNIWKNIKILEEEILINAFVNDTEFRCIGHTLLNDSVMLLNIKFLSDDCLGNFLISVNPSNAILDITPIYFENEPLAINSTELYISGNEVILKNLFKGQHKNISQSYYEVFGDRQFKLNINSNGSHKLSDCISNMKVKYSVSSSGCYPNQGDSYVDSINKFIYQKQLENFNSTTSDDHLNVLLIKDTNSFYMCTQNFEYDYCSDTMIPEKLSFYYNDKTDSLSYSFNDKKVSFYLDKTTKKLVYEEHNNN